MDEHRTRLRDPEYTRYSTPRDWLAVCFRQRRPMALCFCGVALGGVLYAHPWAARYYESSMQLLVMPDRLDAAVSSPAAAAVESSQTVTEAQINSEMALLKGADLLESVAKACGLDHRTGVTDRLFSAEPSARARAGLERATLGLANSLRVEAEKQANVIDVSFGAAGDRETPACVLRTLAGLYLDKRTRLRRPPALLDFFTQQTERYRASLAGAEEQLASFGADGEAVAPDVQRTLVAQKLVDAEAALREAQRAIAEDRQRLDSLLEQLANTPARVLTQEHDEAAGALLQQLEPQLLAARMRREQLAMKFAADYPAVQEADREVAEAETAIDAAEKMELRDQTTDRDPTFELLRQEVAKTRADLAQHDATTAALTRSIRSFQERTVQLDGENVRFQGLLRDAKANEENYLLYLAKREQERSAEALDDRRIANVAIAVPTETPVLPAYSPSKAIGVGLLLGAILSVAVAFVAEYLNGSFRTPADVTDLLGVPVLASVPKQAA